MNCAGGFSGALQSIRPTQKFEGQNKSIKSRVRSTLMIWDTFAVDGIMNVAYLLRYYRGEIKLSISRGYVEGAFSNARKG